ncbi:MAG TPA: hypothetical protein VMV57_11165, partial [Terracidiphilus sp.]|nr:hypothetical protein [Terracidiphilus sp.]
ILTRFAVMRWLMIGLLVSLGALLLAAAGVARHVWLHRKALSSQSPAGTVKAGDEVDLESEL